MKYLYYVGVDVSKEWFDVALLEAQAPRKTRHHRFANTQTGFEALTKWLAKLGIADAKQVFFCVEHTGVYSVPLSIFLTQEELFYSLIPGTEIKASLGINRGKNDEVDAKRIAQYGYKNRDFMRIHTLPEQALRKIKAHLSYRRRLLKAKHSISVAAKELKAHESLEVAQPIHQGSEEVIKEIEIQLKQLEKKISKIIKANGSLKRTYDLLLSVPGIGNQTALYLIVFTQNFTCFNCPRKFASYSGIAPFKSESGKSVKSRSKVSHKANKKMKTLLSTGVNNSVRTCAEYRLYFNRQLEKGKNENSIKNVLRNKIVTRAFAVIKRDAPYEERHAFAC